MKKETFYAIAGIFLLTLCVCIVSITVSYCKHMHSPVAKINYGNMITYEFPAESTYHAARTYWKLENDWTNAMSDEIKTRTQRESEEYDD